MDLNQTMDLNEKKIREEIAFWKDFIEKWKAFSTEPAHRMAVESLAQAEKKLQCYLLAQDIQRTRQENHIAGDPHC